MERYKLEMCGPGGWLDSTQHNVPAKWEAHPTDDGECHTRRARRTKKRPSKKEDAYRKLESAERRKLRRERVGMLDPRQTKNAEYGQTELSTRCVILQLFGISSAATQSSVTVKGPSGAYALFDTLIAAVLQQRSVFYSCFSLPKKSTWWVSLHSNALSRNQSCNTERCYSETELSPSENKQPTVLLYDSNVPNRSPVQKRLRFYNWNPGPRRGREGAIEKQIAGKWHVITLQEASEYVDHELLTKGSTWPTTEDA